MMKDILKQILILCKDKIRAKQRFVRTMQEIRKGEDASLLAQFIRYRAHCLDLDRKRKTTRGESSAGLLKAYIELYENKYGTDAFIKWSKNIISPLNAGNMENQFRQGELSALDEVILGRKSVRKYREKEVMDDILLRLIEMGIQAANACNKQSWRFLIAKRKNDTIKGMRSTKDFGLVELPPAVIYIVNDGRLYFERETALMTIGCVAQNIALKATELGLGACLIHVADKPRIRLSKLLNLNEYESIYLFICVGYPNENPIKPPRGSLNEIASFV